MAGALAVVLVAFVGVTVRFFVVPPLGTVHRPEAVVILDGYGARQPRGLALAREERVHTLVVSVPPGPRPSICSKGTPTLHVTCFVPDPLTTQGEAELIGSLARRRHWRRLLVVAGTTQVVRAELRISRCYAGTMAFSGVDPSGIAGWIHEVAYDEAAMVKALVWQRSC